MFHLFGVIRIIWDVIWFAVSFLLRIVFSVLYAISHVMLLFFGVLRKFMLPVSFAVTLFCFLINGYKTDMGLNIISYIQWHWRDFQSQGMTIALVGVSLAIAVLLFGLSKIIFKPINAIDKLFFRIVCDMSEFGKRRTFDMEKGSRQAKNGYGYNDDIVLINEFKRSTNYVDSGMHPSFYPTGNLLKINFNSLGEYY